MNMVILVSLLIFSSFFLSTNAGSVGSTGQCEKETSRWYTELMGYTKWDRGGANIDGRYGLANLTSSFDVMPHYLAAGKVFASRNNPLVATFLPYARSFTLFDQMTSIPSDGNEPEDVDFDLPAAETIAFDDINDLLYMPIKKMASLIASRRVSCIEVVKFFIETTKRLDPYLALVTVPMYDEAMKIAADLDEEIKLTGKTRGPLTCIPFGVKDHHQIFNETTTNGHILNYNNKFTVKSSLVHQLMKYGAIPIAKTSLGAFASSGPVSGWGICLSPYLNGHGSGSSCGSGSGAAAGVFPFALSEETGGSIAGPAASNFISGYLSSYGVLSRAGADLRAIEFDHLGWHSRYISDYGILLNYARTGIDPEDGDTVSFKFEDPAKINPKSLKALIIGKGAVSSYGITGHKWETERLALIKSALIESGVEVTELSAAEAKEIWSWDESDELFDAFRVQNLIRIFSYANVWGEQKYDQLSARNSRGDNQYTVGSANVPAIAVNYAKAVLMHFGKLFLNDPVWEKYDVIIDTNSLSAGNYPANDNNLEHVVRTAKVFIADHYEQSNVIDGKPVAIEGTTVTVTALPWQEAKAFRIGEIIQEYEPIKSKMMFPEFNKIEDLLEGRTRCAVEFFLRMDATKAMVVNQTDGSPIPDAASRYTIPKECSKPGMEKLTTNCCEQFLPIKWAESLYVAPHELEARGSSAMPLEAISDIERYSEEEICDLKPSFCAYNAMHGYPNSIPGAPFANADSQNSEKCMSEKFLDMAATKIKFFKRKTILKIGIFVMGICVGIFVNLLFVHFFRQKRKQIDVHEK